MAKGEPDGVDSGLQELGLQEGARLAAAVPAASVSPSPRRQARDVVDEALAQKLLLGWIGNRVQVQHPLAFNLERMEPGHATLLLRAVGAAVRAGPAGPARMDRALGWVTRAKGGEAAQRTLQDAVATPPALHQVLEDVRAADLSAHVYAATLAATDQRDEASRAFADYLAARLAIPPELARSLTRKYRA